MDQAAMPSELLAGLAEGRVVIQDYRPLSESLEWELGQSYWKTRGMGAFIGDALPVPYVVNNNGAMSARAADLFFRYLELNQEVVPERLFVLELGIGVGLFARFFLDHFRDLCRRAGKPYYERLTYVLGDISPRMLQDVGRHGVLAGHPGHYVLRVIDAMQPERVLEDAFFPPGRTAPFQAVFLNYILDCLPATVLAVEGATTLRGAEGERAGRLPLTPDPSPRRGEGSKTSVRELRVRTCLARGIPLEDYHPWSPAQLRALADSPDADERAKLGQIFGFLASEYAFVPIDREAVPHAELALGLAKPDKPQVLHNFGALESVRRLTGIVAEGGFVLINDYGNATEGAAESFEHQRFSLSTSVGLNFPLLEAFARQEGLAWETPAADQENIYSRLAGKSLRPALVAHFKELFAKPTFEKAEEPVGRARACAQAGFLEHAIAEYAKALDAQPYNWLLYREAAEFALYTMGNGKVGRELAARGLDLNRASSADLWNALGDCLYALGRMEEARAAFCRALAINPDDVRARYNLAWVYVLRKDYHAALAVIAEALALDKMGQFRERLLKKQAEVLTLLATHTSKELFVMANRVQHGTPRQETRPLPEAAPPTLALRSS